MPVEDSVRPYQLPESALAQLMFNLYNLASNEPVIVKPGFGGQSSPQLPPINVAGGSGSITVTSYMDMAAVELATQSD